VSFQTGSDRIPITVIKIAPPVRADSPHAESFSSLGRNWGHHTVRQESWHGPTGASPVRVRRSEPPGNECCGRRGNAGSEAYTVIAWGMGLRHEMTTLWRPRPSCAPKAKCVVPLSRGAIAPPGSEAISRAKGSCRNLGGPAASAGMVAGGGSQQGITGADCIAAGSRTGPSTVEAVEGNDTVEGRGRPAGTTLEAAKSQTQRWQPLLPNLQRVNAAAAAQAGRGSRLCCITSMSPRSKGHPGGSGARRALGSIG
jgi:hypothetical protein